MRVITHANDCLNERDVVNAIQRITRRYTYSALYLSIVVGPEISVTSYTSYPDYLEINPCMSIDKQEAIVKRRRNTKPQLHINIEVPAPCDLELLLGNTFARSEQLLQRMCMVMRKKPTRSILSMLIRWDTARLQSLKR